MLLGKSNILSKLNFGHVNTGKGRNLWATEPDG